MRFLFEDITTKFRYKGMLQVPKKLQKLYYKFLKKAKKVMPQVAKKLYSSVRHNCSMSVLFVGELVKY